MIPMGSWGNKDPDEKLRFGIDWSGDLADGDTISTSDWFVDQGDVTLGTKDNNTTTTATWVEGGTINTTCLIRNHCVTAMGAIFDGTMRLDIRSK